MTKLTIAASNLNIPRFTAICGDYKAYELFLTEAGYAKGYELANTYTGGGFEWSEVRNIRNLWGRRIALQLAARSHITSLHQSWRSTKLVEILGRLFKAKPSLKTLQKLLESLSLVAIIPYIDSWKTRLSVIQEAAQTALPVVVHPNEQQPPLESRRFYFDYPKDALEFQVLRWQPTVETLLAWDVLATDMTWTVDGMLKEQVNHGIKEVALDLKHLFATRHGQRFNDPIAACRLIAQSGSLTEIQLNLTDNPKLLRRIINSGFDGTHFATAFKELFRQFDAERAMTISIEVRATDFYAIGIRDVITGNQQIIRALLDLIEEYIS